MITKDNFRFLLEKLEFKNENDVYIKKFNEFECELKVDFQKEELIFPTNKGFIVNDKTTSNFSSAENFVVFECVDKLLSQGYNPKHIELEPKWQVGHGASGGKADILIKDNDEKSLLIIECKTAGNEYTKAISTLENNSNNQLFSYFQQIQDSRFLALYTSDFLDDKVISNYYLINVTDNKELLKNNPKLKSYKNTSDAIDKYQVWCKTYDKEYTTIGLFENNEAYKIGKTKFSINDLKDISSKDIQGKYHEFATILRQHNVSGRENAFDKLVNLFLCKVTDEKENPNELKFYWKGKAYDYSFDFQDRLQQLYKIGMDKFLDDEIVYIANEKIDEAFGVFKDKPNATKDAIKKFIKELKFFTNNDFAFIDVHNEKLFKQNFEVLLKISKIIQDIKLTGSEENQFLGDMFESFLDQGVKQSEGQFFTPMPLVKFIINSLPSKQNPKVLDYACGSGHFLNEYATQNKDASIVGVEKEYRLSKVAKVSSFMYGSDIDIIYSDALTKNEKLKDNSFDVLIANPPYSVKGFLQTLSDEDKANFELIDEVDTKSYSKTGAIECFFIERAKQLLTKEAVVGIIVPSSILNKDTPKLYTKTRELIFESFDIVAIAEFGSGTFGKTGTNTVTLFLKRISDNPNLKQHYKNMIDEWFNGDIDTNKVFKDSDILEKYCNHIEIDFEVYKSLLSNIVDDKLLDYEIFKEYKIAFEKESNTKNRKKKKYYKELSKEKKEELEKTEFIKYIKTIEKDKLLYFALAQKQNNDIIIVKSPSKNDENKKFLGYEWGGRKGNEGIQYLTSAKIELDGELEDEDKRVLENLQGLKHINTPLYNPQDIDDNTKINKLIKDTFDGLSVTIPDELKQYVSSSRLIDMMDFKRVEFNKAINLNPAKKVEIKSKWELVKLGDCINFLPKSKRPASYGLSSGKYPFFTSSQIQDKWIDIADYSQESIIIGDGGNSSIFISNLFSVSDHNFIFYSKNKELLNNYIYIFYFINFHLILMGLNGVGLKNISKNYIQNLKIPLAPLNIQEKIVKECEIIDNKSEELKAKNNEYKKEIKNHYQELLNKANTTYKLSDETVFKAFIGKRVLAKDISQNSEDGIRVYSANVYEPFGYTKKEFLEDFSKDSVLWGIDGDWMVNHIDKNIPFYPTDHCGVIKVLKDKTIESKYLSWALEQIGNEQRFSRANRASTARIKALSIKVPDYEFQKQIVSKIETLESKIKENSIIIDSSKDIKESILKKYL